VVAEPVPAAKGDDEVQVWTMVKDLEAYNEKLVDFIQSKGLEVPELSE